jgi:carbon-monoxide dehydrogenase small subunit
VIADRRARGIEPVAGGGIGALGPAGSAHPPGEQAFAMPRATRAPAGIAPAAHVEGTPIPKRREEWRPQFTLEQHFTVAHPPEKVWAFFGQPAEVAACLPGAVLTGEPSQDRVEGKLRVRAGPIVAEFSGAAEIERDVSHYAGMIRGQGKDNRSGSATRGEIAYKLSPEAGGNATRVDVTVGYTLTGMLAQFSRSGLIQDVANRLTSAFAKNLEMRLGTEGALEQAAPAAELNAGSMIFSVLGDRLRRFLRRLFNR